MNLFRVDGCRPIWAESANDAAEITAGRMARREYGRRARVGTLRCDCWTQDNSVVTWEAFIGRKTGLHETTGRNVWFQTVFVEAAP
jgi:hypothetical protein